MRNAGLALAALMLGGCVAAGPAAPAEMPTQTQTQAHHAVATHGFNGRYTLATVDGVAIDNPFDNTRPTLIVEPGAIYFASQCIGRSWSWRDEDGAIRSAPYVRPTGEGVIGSCARGLLQFEQAVVDAMTGIEQSRLLGNGDLVVSGGGHRLGFVRLSAPDIALYGRWRVEMLDGETLAPHDRVILYGNDTQLWWEPICAGQQAEIALTFAESGTGWSAERLDTAGRPVCSIGLPPRLGDVWQALEAADSVQWTGTGGLAIEGDGRSVVLERASDEPPR